MKFDEFNEKHWERMHIDSEGYLEQCMGFEGDSPRISKSILKPQTYDNLLGAPVMNGVNNIMSGNISRLPQNILLNVTEYDFSPMAFHDLNRPPKRTYSVRLFGNRANFYDTDRQPDKLGYVVKWCVSKNAQELHLQFATVPNSRSEFVSKLLSAEYTTCTNLTHDQIRNVIDHCEKLSIYHSKDKDRWFETLLEELYQTSDATDKANNATNNANTELPDHNALFNAMLELKTKVHQFPIIKQTVLQDTCKKFQCTAKVVMKKDENVYQFDTGSDPIVFRGNVFLFSHEIDKNATEEGGFTYDLCDNVQIKDYCIKVSNINYTLTTLTPNISYDTIKTYLTSIFRKNSTFDETKVQMDDINLKLRTGIELPKSGFVYTTDYGIQTGVPLTHTTTRTFSFGNDVGTHKNMCDSTVVLELDEKTLNISHTRSYVLLLLKTLRERAHSNRGNFLMVTYKKDGKDDKNVKACKFRCMLMAILKVFPVVGKNETVLEHRHLIGNEPVVFECDKCDKHINDVKLIMGSGRTTNCNLLNNKNSKKYGRICRNHQHFNSLKLTENDLDTYFCKVQLKHFDFKLKHSNKYLHIACVGRNSNFDPWTTHTTFAHKNQVYRNKACKPLVCICNDDEQYKVTIDSIYTKADMIPISFKGENDLFFITNREFDHPLSFICPIHPVYQSTESTDGIHILMRPFPTIADIDSMVEFCHNKGDELFNVFIP